MLASELIASLRYARLSQPDFTDFTVSTLTQDTREVKDGAVFVAVVGAVVDGHQFVGQAVANGAKMIIAQKPVETDVPVVYVKDTHRAMAMLADRFYGQPSRQLQMTGVTGTNGKTTVTHIIEQILHDLGDATGMMGTMGLKINDDLYPTKNTTPDIITSQRMLAKMVKAGVHTAAMEVSSIALAQGRVWGIDYDICVFTNFSEDHLAYHKTMSQYKLAKSLLFAQMGNEFNDHKAAVLNIDDPVGREFMQYTSQNVLTYGLNADADIYATDVKICIEGSDFCLHVLGQKRQVHSHLIGKFNVYNLLAAVGAATAAGVSLDDIVKSIDHVTGVKGRFQKVNNDTGVHVIVDYAHTPDGLLKVLKTMRDFVDQDIYVVVGCGGDRDAQKRPQMAKIAVDNSDHAIFTEDNPRTEDPHQIMDDMLKGVADGAARVIFDRAEAIKTAITAAKPGDAVLIAGKGHEDYQIIGRKKRHFDDFEQARAALAARK